MCIRDSPYIKIISRDWRERIMDDNRRYEAFVRNRITELREQKGVSEHRMSLELGKSGSYIRSITNGISMPSLRELFNIMEYFDLTPTLFFAPMEDVYKRQA